MAGSAGGRVAVVVPGRRYGVQAPLLAYAADAAADRGARVRAVQWSDPVPGTSEELVGWAGWQVASVLDGVGGAPLIIGKSLGSYAATLAAERGLPAVWLTPLLLDEAVVAALRRASAPLLLVGGTADGQAWDGTVARDLTSHVCEVAGADHIMRVPGPLAASAAVLGQVATAVERFLDEAVWPP
jgi:hypothetical protein